MDNTLTCQRWYKWFLNTFKWQNKAFASPCFSPGPQRIGYLSLWLHQDLSPPGGMFKLRFDWYIRVRFFGKIKIHSTDLSLESWFMKGTDESTLSKDCSVPFGLPIVPKKHTLVSTFENRQRVDPGDEFFFLSMYASWNVFFSSCY